MLEITTLSKTFFPHTQGEVRALRDINLHIHEGCFTAVIGTNGSGKSTLLNAVAGVFPPDRGSILIDGQDITRWPEYRRARWIGRVFQNPFAGSCADMSIVENIVMAMGRGLPKTLRRAVTRQAREEIASRVRDLKMGLEDRLDNPMGALSGGQRQALTLLMAVWRRPKLLLLDEHTAALDPGSAAKVAELTKEIIDREQLTALMVTHSMQQAVTLPDRIIMMHRGEMVGDYREEMKRRVRVSDLMAAFDRLARRDRFDASAAMMINRQYG